MRRHYNWSICSLLIVVTACNASVTQLLGVIMGGRSRGSEIWHTVLVSTFLVAVFGKILPRYIIPRHSISYAYYCYPLMWCLMWLTAPVSWILGTIIDKLSGALHDNDIYTHQQLNTLIKYQDRLEKHGGSVGPDAARVMRSALDLDGRTVTGGKLGYFERALKSDVENGELTERFDTITTWSQVKTVGIQDIVNRDFVRKIKDWSYSRIPVVGTDDHRTTLRRQHPESQQIYGFLHIKVSQSIYKVKKVELELSEYRICSIYNWKTCTESKCSNKSRIYLSTHYRLFVKT